MDERKTNRDQRARDEQRLAKRIEERNVKKQLPPPEWHNRNLFPECGYDPFSDKRYFYSLIKINFNEILKCFNINFFIV